MALLQIYNEHLLKILCNSLMRELVRCHNQFKEEFKEQMHFWIRNREMDDQE